MTALLPERAGCPQCGSLRLAYADPPYIGRAKVLYDCPEVDHVALIKQLQEYDGWALSCHSPSLRVLLPLCPEECRVGAWVKPFAFFKGGVRPPFTWEPLIFKSARPNKKHKHLVRDWISCNAYGVTPAERAVTNVKGIKPQIVCHWMFDLIGAEPSDEFFDMFYGSGAVTEAWRTYGLRGTN